MLEVRANLSPEGYRLILCRRRVEGWPRKRVVLDPVADPEGALDDVNPLAAGVLDELKSSGNLTLDDAGFSLKFSAAAELNNTDASSLNLLPAFPYQLDLQSRGALGTAAFRIDYQASNGGVRVAGVFSDGLFEDEDGVRYRFANPLYSILAEIDRLNREDRAQEKLSHFAALKTLLPNDIGDSNVNPDQFLLRVRIAHVTAISLKPTIAEGNVSFDPVPMRRRDTEDNSAGAELAIPPIACDKFAHEFRAQRAVNATYALETGNYVYIDPSVLTALRVVKKKQSASLEERVAFLMSPSAAISEAYGEGGHQEGDTPIGNSIFFETAEYSERVTGIGEWLPPQLPYLEKSENNWLPERFSVILGDKLVTGKPEDVPAWIEFVKTAIASQKPTVEVGKVQIPTDTPGLLLTLQKLHPPELPPRGELETSSPNDPKSPRRRTNVLQTLSNFDQAEFKRQLKPRRLSNASLPAMKTRLKDHRRARRQLALQLIRCRLARRIACGRYGSWKDASKLVVFNVVVA